MANPTDPRNADLYSSSRCDRSSIWRGEHFNSVRASFAEMVSSSAPNPSPVHRHGPAPGAFPQPNRKISFVILSESEGPHIDSCITQGTLCNHRFDGEVPRSARNDNRARTCLQKEASEFLNPFEMRAASERQNENAIIFGRVLETKTPFPSTNPVASRALSAFELLFGAFIVIGHNVFRIVPNEVIILFVLGLASIRLRDGRWSSMGFKRPAS